MIKKLIFIAVLLAAATGCKKDKADHLAKIEGIVGRWKVTEIEDSQNGKMIWQKAHSAGFISFRTDGTVVDNNENLICCAPDMLTIDGVTIKLPPATGPTSPSCSSIKCAGCSNWEIEQHGDEIIITMCNSPRIKYARD